jgi:exodeoxyribonuclease V alpha subunit
VAAALEAQDRAGRPGAPDGGYEGRALLVVENDPGIGLWNGDLALVVADPARPGQLVAAVAGPAGEAARLVPLGRLPACESALCTTIHKSQGSEVDAVGVLLPAWSTPLLTRELVYTAVTRARHQVTIYASEAVLREALARRDERPSGLPDRLAVLLG